MADLEQDECECKHEYEDTLVLGEYELRTIGKLHGIVGRSSLTRNCSCGHIESYAVSGGIVFGSGDTE